MESRPLALSKHIIVLGNRFPLEVENWQMLDDSIDLPIKNSACGAVVLNVDHPLELIEQLSPSYTSVPVVALIDGGNLDAVDALFDAGIDDICMMPSPTMLVQRRVERMMQEHNTRAERNRYDAELRALFTTTPVGVGLYDTQFRFLRLNQALADINGLPVEAHYGKTPRELIPGIGEDASFKKFEEVMRTGEPVRFEVVGQTQAEHPTPRSWLVTYYPVKYEKRVIGLGAMVMDITEQRDLEKRLYISEVHFKAALSGSDVVVFSLDTDFRYTWVHNPVIPVAADALVGKTDYEIIDEQAADVLRANYQLALDTGELAECDVTFTNQATGQPQTVHVSAQPFMDLNGEVEGLIGSAVDITRVKKMEAELRQRAIDELIQRNQELDEFAYTVAHDLRNPLTTLMGYAEMLIEYKDKLNEEQVSELNHHVLENARHLNGIITGLLLLARVDHSSEINVAVVDMSDLIEQTVLSLGSLIADNEAQIDVPEDCHDAVGYRPWITEVWSNYIANAIKYGGNPPQIEIGCELQDDHMVRYWVRDNGLGMTPEDQLRIFTPFTRLTQDRHRAEGHGLGLTIVQRIVNRLGGDVGVESEPGQGSTFYFTLPAAQESVTLTLPQQHPTEEVS